MNLSTRMVLVLTTVGLISGGMLATVGILTQEQIEKNKQREIKAAISQVIPGTKDSGILFEEEDLIVYGGSDETGNLIGFAVLVSGTGFQDKIKLMYGMNQEMTKINRLAVLEQKETPGLGAKIASQETFLQFWENKDSSGALKLRKPAASSSELAASDVNTITGATISSEKVLEIVNLSLDKVKRLKKEGRLKKEDGHGS